MATLNNASHLSSGPINLGLLREDSRRELIRLLDKCAGSKVTQINKVFYIMLMLFNLLNLMYCTGISMGFRIDRAIWIDCRIFLVKRI